MLTLFVRVLILYIFVFLVIRITGKRQLSELQPFDLVMTLLIADLASVPASDTAVPLIYGLVPILTLFLLHQLVSFLSMKSEEIRKFVCGRSVFLISRGIVQEEALRATRYTLNDLMEQLRSKDVFDLTDVEAALLETNGDLSVLLKGDMQQPTYKDMGLPPPTAAPPYMIIQDGKIHFEALRMAGRDENWLKKKLNEAGLKGERDAFYLFLDSDDVVHMQSVASLGARDYHIYPDGRKDSDV